MTGIPTPEAVEVMTDSDFAAMTAEFRSIGTGGAQHIRASWSDRIVYSLWLRCAQIESRAIPLPRRYTGGPLGDGLYLWKAPHWTGTNDWVSASTTHEISDALTWNGWPFIWLIGPIPIPDLPEEEAKS